MVSYARISSKTDADIQEFEVEFEYVKGNAGLQQKCDDKKS